MKFDVTSMLSSIPATVKTLSVQEIPIDLLVPYGKHPFTLYTGERLDDMVQSVKNNGILTPIIVRDAAGKYEILAGHNRTNAAKIAGLTTVPAVVKPISAMKMPRCMLSKPISCSVDLRICVHQSRRL